MKFSSLFLVFLLSGGVLLAQKKAPTQPELESGTIESQFSYIIEKSSSFKDFQLIRKSSILKVKSNALDSLKTIRKNLNASQSEVNGLSQKINSLTKEVNKLKEEINLINEGVESISIFGKNMNKTSYSTMVWSIIGVLIVILIFFVLRFKNSNSVTKRTKRELDKIENEFESFRKKSLKKEQEIMRKLQDEINKNNM